MNFFDGEFMLSSTVLHETFDVVSAHCHSKLADYRTRTVRCCEGEVPALDIDIFLYCPKIRVRRMGLGFRMTVVDGNHSATRTRSTLSVVSRF